MGILGDLYLRSSLVVGCRTVCSMIDAEIQFIIMGREDALEMYM